MSNISTQQTFSESAVRQIICERDKEWFQIIESILNFHPVSMTEALKVGIDRMKLLKSTGDELLEWLKDGTISDSNYRLLANAWQRAKENKP